ncbi:MAG: hypothetical protein DCF25_22365 [Leptolyngbya foveolarum]|uniref:Uncharacterized protein n=1 Tax=Leptolyngbya foveolarum TaxID=47253 RepID=A0A2W4VMD6_9CYAN|nr:MAG: hypothetical protein DCF25_22365 [Leptolyngbya foveolarum]
MKNSTAKYKNPDYKKGTYYLRKTVTHEMRIYAATMKMEMSDLFQMAVQQFMEKHPPKQIALSVLFLEPFSQSAFSQNVSYPQP